jgi:hypothetical protein
MGETRVFWHRHEQGPLQLQVLVEICEPKPGVVDSIAEARFIRAPGGSFVGE